MRDTGLTLWAVLLVGIAISACEREAPPKPVGSSTNKHFEQSPTPPSRTAPDTITGSMRSPLEQAQEAGSVVQRADEGSSKQLEPASP